MAVLEHCRQPASAKWYDRRDYVFIEFCVEDSKDVNVNFEKSKLTFSCLGGSDNFKHLNEIDLFNNIDPNESKHKRTDRSILCCLRKGESGQAWPRLTKERAKVGLGSSAARLNWLSVDFNNWKDWEDDSDEDMSNFDRFSEVREDEYLEAWVSFWTDSCRKGSVVPRAVVSPAYAVTAGRDGSVGSGQRGQTKRVLRHLEFLKTHADSPDSDDEKMPDLE
ncbi:hypothetical protein QYF61_006360 [Mycteria americana]|uniref:Prostaglandin E synthase 3 n=2 Tax=Neoaves TaxID=3078114 RepID=A0AAN7MK50_MYCAM|nr:hypothetical protein QYF61_006360 [Mycteria americana]